MCLNVFSAVVIMMQLSLFFFSIIVGAYIIKNLFPSAMLNHPKKMLPAIVFAIPTFLYSTFCNNLISRRDACTLFFSIMFVNRVCIKDKNLLFSFSDLYSFKTSFQVPELLKNN